MLTATKTFKQENKVEKLLFPYYSVHALTHIPAHLQNKLGSFVFFDLKELNKPVREPDEYQYEIYLTAEEVGQLLGGS